MTRRERLLTALRCEEPDRPPVRLLNAAPAALNNFHESWRPLLELALKKTEIIAFLPLPGQPSFSAYCQNHRKVFEEPDPEAGWVRRTTVFETPKGGLCQIIKVSPKGATAVTVKCLIETEEDAQRFLSAPDEPILADLAPLPALDAEVGDRGIVSIDCPDPGCWVHSMLGSEAMAFWSVDNRDMLHAVFDKVHRNQIAMLKSALGHTRGRLVSSGSGAEKWIPPLMSPTDFEEFLAPSLREIATLVHETDGLLWYHCHGRVRNFIARFAELGVDCLQPVEPPPLGDVTLRDAKRLAAGKMCLEGNLQWGEIITGTPAGVRRMTAAALSEGAPGGAFILGLSAGLHGPYLGEAERERLSAFIEAGTAYR